MQPEFLTRNGAPALAYIRYQGREDLPTIMFCGGFRSDMGGTKAVFLDEICRARGQSFVRFDYTGHGQSGGDFIDGTIGAWLFDALCVFDTLTSGQIILVGSSMGGWIGLKIAIARSSRMAGFIGLASAPDFTRDIKHHMNEAQLQALDNDGVVHIPNDYGDPYPITRRLIEEGENHILLETPLNISCPVRLIQGMKDTDVPWQTAHRIANLLTTNDKKVYLREDGDHRLSGDGDLALLKLLVEEF